MYNPGQNSWVITFRILKILINVFPLQKKSLISYQTFKTTLSEGKGEEELSMNLSFFFFFFSKRWRNTPAFWVCFNSFVQGCSSPSECLLFSANEIHIFIVLDTVFSWLIHNWDTCVAIPAWSHPGFHKAVFPICRFLDYNNTK